MEFVLLFAGKAQPPILEEAAAEYIKRLQKIRNWQLERIRDERIDKRPADQIKTAEAKRFLSRIRDDDHVVLCDERGKGMSTDQLAAAIGAATRGDAPFTGKRRVIYIIGGALGVDDSLRQRANQIWRLSELTLAGGVARVVLTEALYRAECICRNHPYHNR